jgi:hypothetical protein
MQPASNDKEKDFKTVKFLVGCMLLLTFINFAIGWFIHPGGFLIGFTCLWLATVIIVVAEKKYRTVTSKRVELNANQKLDIQEMMEKIWMGKV